MVYDPWLHFAAVFFFCFCLWLIIREYREGMLLWWLGCWAVIWSRVGLNCLGERHLTDLLGSQGLGGHWFRMSTPGRMQGVSSWRLLARQPWHG